MPPLTETILTTLIAQAVNQVPNLIRIFADQTKPNPPAPDLKSQHVQQAIEILAIAVAHGIAATAYQASLDRPRVGRQQDLPPLQTPTA